MLDIFLQAPYRFDDLCILAGARPRVDVRQFDALVGNNQDLAAIAVERGQQIAAIVAARRDVVRF